MANFAISAVIIGAVVAMTSTTATQVYNSTTSRRLAEVAYTARSLDMPGKDIGQAKAPRPDVCFARCQEVSKCGAFTWTNFEGGTCFLKTAWSEPVIKVGAYSGLLVDTSLAPFARVARGVYKACDMPGFDIGQAKGTLTDCDRLCFDKPQCKAVTWTNYNGGTCFYKSDVRECAPVAGATTVVVFNHLVTA